MPKLPPMPNRDAGGMFSLSNPDDGTPIREMFPLDGGLLLITEKCTYQVKLADQIDPKRTNPALPHNVHSKLFDHGTNSELLCNTLILAKVMFRKECQPQLNVERAMQLAFAALSEAVSMNGEAQAFKAAEQGAMERAQVVSHGSRTVSIPTVGNVRAQCKTFMQKADHFAVALSSIIRLFYPEGKKLNWGEFHEMVGKLYGEDDLFCQVTALTTPLLQLVRNTRDCLEHNNQGVMTSDFEMQPDGTIAQPTIEIDFRGSSHERCPISWFMEQTTKALLNAFEMMVVHTCSKHVQSLAGMPIVVSLLPEDYRAAWRVRFGYGMYYADGKFAPFG